MQDPYDVLQNYNNNLMTGDAKKKHRIIENVPEICSERMNHHHPCVPIVVFVLQIICRIRSMPRSSWHRVLTSHDHSGQKIKLISWHISDNVLDALEPPADKFIRIFVLCRMNDQRYCNLLWQQQQRISI